VRSGSGQLIGDVHAGSVYFTSELARDLAPPQQPVACSYPRALLTAIAGWVAGAFLLLLIEGLQAQALITVPGVVLDTGRLTAWLWFGAGIPLLAFALAYRQQRELKLRLPEWQAAFERWTLLYYCPRDDALFLPLLGEAYPPDQMHELLSLQPAGSLEAVH
jgi:hypothetical protein